MQSSSGRVPAAVLACALLAAGCGPAARRVTPPPAFAEPRVVTGTGYRLDAARSELRILVYRDGALIRAERLERFPAKWIPVRVKKTRQIKK